MPEQDSRARSGFTGTVVGFETEDEVWGRDGLDSRLYTKDRQSDGLRTRES